MPKAKNNTAVPVKMKGDNPALSKLHILNLKNVSRRMEAANPDVKNAYQKAIWLIQNGLVICSADYIEQMQETIRQGTEEVLSYLEGVKTELQTKESA